jgi:phosphinothricin acetyltransferase
MTRPALAKLRDATPDDAPAIADIYAGYVRDSIATFELVPPDADEMRRRIARVTATWPWMVAEADGRVLGWAYAIGWKERAAYRHSAETTIYLDAGATGRGLGRRLYGALLERLPALGVRVAIGGVSLPNPASVALHEALGYEPVGVFREVGWKFDRWIDVGYWQKVFPETGGGAGGR